jgi:hypothetical protein
MICAKFGKALISVADLKSFTVDQIKDLIVKTTGKEPNAGSLISSQNVSLSDRRSSVSYESYAAKCYGTVAHVYPDGSVSIDSAHNFIYGDRISYGGVAVCK